MSAGFAITEPNRGEGKNFEGDNVVLLKGHLDLPDLEGRLWRPEDIHGHLG